jgi:hypothetical protein
LNVFGKADDMAMFRSQEVRDLVFRSS